MKTVIDDPDAPTLPFGCISPKALVSLATAMRALIQYHRVYEHAPCLRRIESASGDIIAHISIGPAIGGTWERLRFDSGTKSWMLVRPENEEDL